MSAPAIARIASVERETTQSETQIQQDISNLAYALWQHRGFPEGSAQQDWYEAEQTLAAREVGRVFGEGETGLRGG